MTTPAPVSAAVSNCLQGGRQRLLDEGQTQGMAIDISTRHCEQLLTWGIAGANSSKNTANNRKGLA
jgi:hypothetical protein